MLSSPRILNYSFIFKLISKNNELGNLPSWYSYNTFILYKITHLTWTTKSSNFNLLSLLFLFQFHFLLELIGVSNILVLFLTTWNGENRAKVNTSSSYVPIPWASSACFLICDMISGVSRCGIFFFFLTDEHLTPLTMSVSPRGGKPLRLRILPCQKQARALGQSPYLTASGSNTLL